MDVPQRLICPEPEQGLTFTEYVGARKKESSVRQDQYADRSRKVPTYPDQTGHPAGLAIAPVGEKTLRIAGGAEVSAAHPTHATPLQRAPRPLLKIGIPAGGMIGAGPKAM